MAFNLENMTIDLKKLSKMIPTDRMTLAQNGAVDDLISVLTPGQLARLFPKYYRDKLPDIGQTNGTSLGGALSGGTNFSSSGTGSTYSSVSPPVPSKSAQEMSVDQILKENGIIPKTPVMVGPAETGFFGAIMRAEGTNAEAAAKHGFASPYDTVLGYGKYGMPDKPLSEMTIAEVYDFQRNTLLKNHGTSSAAGAFQIVSRNILDKNGELTSLMKGAGLSLNDKFDGTAQRKLAYEIYKAQGLGAWEGFKFHPEEAQKASAEAQNVTIESTTPSLKGFEQIQEQRTPLSDDIRKQLDPKTLEIYDKATVEQKWNMEQAINAVGVQGFNEVLKKQSINETTVNNTSEKFSILKGNIEDVNPKLQNVINAASNDLPDGFTVRAISGKDERSTGTKNHPNGLAMDVQIYDSQGKLVPYDKNSDGWKYYEMLYRSAHIRGQEMYPNDKFIWGGAWISEAAGRGDPMHYQIVDPSIKGTSQSSGRYSFESGLDPNHPFAAEGGQLTKEERAAFDASVRNKIKTEKEKLTNSVPAPPTPSPDQAVSDPVDAALKNVPKSKPSEAPTAAPLPAVPDPVDAALKNTSKQTQTDSNTFVPPKIPSGMDTNTQISPQAPTEIPSAPNTFVPPQMPPPASMDKSTQNINGNLKVDASTIKQEPAPVQQAEAPKPEQNEQYLMRRPDVPVPQENPDPNFFASVTSGSMASSPSQVRALNRAKLYNDDSGSLVNGHFA